MGLQEEKGDPMKRRMVQSWKRKQRPLEVIGNSEKSLSNKEILKRNRICGFREIKTKIAIP